MAESNIWTSVHLQRIYIRLVWLTPATITFLLFIDGRLSPDVGRTALPPIRIDPGQSQMVRAFVYLPTILHRCREVITDICLKMETGMADFAHRAATSITAPYLTSIEEYDLYCHYVAGLVGEGLSRLFAATKKERPWIADQLVLSNSMGLLLQKTNILRDFREDCDEGRYFWPREIWGVYGLSKPEEMTATGGRAQKPAPWVLRRMTLHSMGAAGAAPH